MNKSLHKKVADVIETRDYGIFKTHYANRQTKTAKVNKLAALMLKYGWLVASVVFVDKNFFIIDGQHRVKAAQIAQVPVRYIIIPVEASVELIRSTNINRLNWSLMNSVMAYAKETDKPDYSTLADFIKEYSFLHPTDAMMIVKNSTRAPYREEIESGEFRVKNIEVAKEWARQIERYKSIPGMEKEYNARSWVRILTKVFLIDGVDANELFRKAQQYPFLVKNFKNDERNLEMFEKLYNYKRRQDKIRFF